MKTGKALSKFHKITVGILLSSFCICESSEAAEKSETVQLDHVISACKASPTKDQVCDLLVRVRQVGDNAIEAVKEFVDLSPQQYFVLTVANAISQKRVRIRTKSYFKKDLGPMKLSKSQNTLDIKDNSVTYLLEWDF